MEGLRKRTKEINEKKSTKDHCFWWLISIHKMFITKFTIPVTIVIIIYVYILFLK